MLRELTAAVFDKDIERVSDEENALVIEAVREGLWQAESNAWAASARHRYTTG